MNTDIDRYLAGLLPGTGTRASAVTTPIEFIATALGFDPGEIRDAMQRQRTAGPASGLDLHVRAGMRMLGMAEPEARPAKSAPTGEEGVFSEVVDALLSVPGVKAVAGPAPAAAPTQREHPIDAHLRGLRGLL